MAKSGVETTVLCIQGRCPGLHKAWRMLGLAIQGKYGILLGIMNFQKVLVSACLLGEKVRYDGSDYCQHGLIEQWQREGRVVPLCPERVGGLPIPRPPAEIESGSAEAVLQGRNSIRRKDGTDVSEAFLQGAEKALAECWKHKIKIAILKEGSPSCGAHQVNDGTFSGTKIGGQGLTACLLARHGISVFSEGQMSKATKRMVELEG